MGEIKVWRWRDTGEVAENEDMPTEEVKKVESHDFTFWNEFSLALYSLLGLQRDPSSTGKQQL